MHTIEITIPSVINSHSEEETISIGKQLAEKLQPGDVVLLFGDLGSGKTRFVQGMCDGLKVDEPVVSPTFTIINQYTGTDGDNEKFRINHIDCYRLKVTDELIDIGMDEILASEDISVIEWPQIALPLIRDAYWKITIEPGDGEFERVITIDHVMTDDNDCSGD